MAADLEGPGLCKGFGNILARVLLVAVEGETRPLDIDLVDEVVIVGEGQAFTAVDGDFGGTERAALLDDGMGLVGGKGRHRQQYEQGQTGSHQAGTGDSITDHNGRLVKRRQTSGTAGARHALSRWKK